MSFFNDAQRDGLLTGRYICSECGGLMEFEDEWEDTLVCPACGHSVDLEHYGMENDEEYDALYPTRDQSMASVIFVSIRFTIAALSTELKKEV